MNLTDKELSEELAAAQKRIARYDQYFDQRTFSVTLQKTSKPQKKLSNKKSVLVVRRVIDHRGQYDHTEIDIRSAALCKVLMEINKDVEGLELTLNPPAADPKLFFHSYLGLKDRLEKEQSKNSPNEALIADLNVALQFIEEDHGSNLADFTGLTAHQEITYDLLWALFAPNTLVHQYHHFTEQVRILLVRSLRYSMRQDKTRCALIECDVVGNDGNAVGLARDILEINMFSGTRKIQDLSVYPLKYHKDKEAIREHALRRGKNFVKMVRHSYNEISGQAMRETMNHAYEFKRFKFNAYGRVMIDPVAFRIFEPICTFNLPVHTRLDLDGLTDEQYIICTPIVLGFCFGVKMWGGFAMDRLQEVVWSDEAFRSLVLGAKQKSLIYSLVKQHAARSKTFDDVVQGKGRGLIGLFSGSPGCGKTLTAEAVAEVTRRPLYVVSAGELGTNPSDVDKSLTRILELAQIWDAVLLLDEAEVFLQRRSVTDIWRNALVSIFLRQLEYYQGVLVLTTNLIEQCDAAFESRIHFSIHFPDLDFESRKAIWGTFLRKATKGAVEISDEGLNQLSEHRLNGRQIKNAVSSAQSIALDNDSKLSLEHVEVVLEVMKDWKTTGARRVAE